MFPSAHAGRFSSAPSASAEASPDDDTDALLSGTEMLHCLMSDNARKIQESKERVASYSELRETLSSLLEKTRHAILAPVANGLAYFEAEIVHTNEVTVLLGDNWFAERSVHQAVQICNRRLDFLGREQRTLTDAAKQLEAKMQIIETEFANELPNRPQNQNRQQAAASAPANLPEGDEALEDADEFAFAEEDELTGEELEALEREIGLERLADDEYVEQCMLDWMIAKRDARLARENAVFGSGSPGPDEETRAPKAATTTNCSSSVASSSSLPPVVTFQSPGDISAFASSLKPSCATASAPKEDAEPVGGSVEKSAFPSANAKTSSRQSNINHVDPSTDVDHHRQIHDVVVGDRTWEVEVIHQKRDEGATHGSPAGVTTSRKAPEPLQTTEEEKKIISKRVSFSPEVSGSEKSMRSVVPTNMSNVVMSGRGQPVVTTTPTPAVSTLVASAAPSGMGWDNSEFIPAASVKPAETAAAPTVINKREAPEEDILLRASRSTPLGEVHERAPTGNGINAPPSRPVGSQQRSVFMQRMLGEGRKY